MKKDEQVQIQFLLSLIKKDIHHYETQQEAVKKWIQQSILSLKQPDAFLLEELKDEYNQKVSQQTNLLSELKKTLTLYENKA
jgi:2-C-methyl-D-erythritol 4-phosphate cytidylyltransferase